MNYLYLTGYAVVSQGFFGLGVSIPIIDGARYNKERYMDFLDPKKRRQHAIRLMIGYVLVAIAVLLATTLLIMYAYGFRLSRDGQLNQNGLVFVSSQPTNGRVLIDGEEESTTNAKLNLPAGRYNMVISRDGYVDWRRRILVEGGSVDHYVYPLLLPTEFTSETVQTFPTTPVFTSQTPDKRWLLVQESAGDRFSVYDLNRNPETVAETTELVVPVSITTPTEKPATWEAVEWTSNNRHLLAVRNYVANEQKQSEYILIDRVRPEGSHNLTNDLSLAKTATVTLRDKKADLYYVFDEAEKWLSTASLSEPTPVLVSSNVLQYKSYGPDILLYATDVNTNEGQTRLVLKNKDRVYDIRRVAASDTYLLDIARYDGEWYVVVGSSREPRVYLYEDPVRSITEGRSGRAVTSFAFSVNRANHVAFSANAQFIAVQNSTDIHVYDIDNVRAYRYELPFPLDKPQTRATWMDGYRLTYVSSGKQVLFEYDRNNSREITESSAARGGFFDRNNQYLYTFTKPDSKKPETALTVTPLRIPSDL